MRSIKFKYWLRFTKFIITWFALSFFGFISLMVVIDFYRRHYMGKNDNSPFLNYTSDGDFGPAWFMPNFKRGLITAFCWWLRNHSWEYVTRNAQPSTADKNKIQVLYPKNLTDEEYADMMQWSSHKNKLPGFREIYYIAEDKVCGRLSYANSWFTFQIGSGGDRYKFLLTPIWPVLVLSAVLILLIIYI